MSAPTLPAELQAFRLLKDSEAAALLGISPQTLRNARFSKKGPFSKLPVRRLGTACRYSLADLIAFSDASKVEAANEL
jgi:hypothetical protein